MRGQPRFHLIRYPQTAAIQEYEDAASEMQERLERLPGLVAIYRTGSVSAPGISDLDYIAVVERDAPAPPIWHGLSERTRYLALHPPFLIDTETFARHRWFAHLEPLEHVSGSPLALADVPRPESTGRLVGLEATSITVLKLARQATTRQVKVRSLLCELYTLRHDLTLLGLERAAAAEAWSVVDTVSELRRRWFAGISRSEQAEGVRALISTAFPALTEALQEFGRGTGIRPIPAGVHSLRLNEPWSNVRLVADDALGSAVRAAWPAIPFMRFSRRLAERWWRLTPCYIGLPRAALAALAGISTDPDFRNARDNVVRSYRRFMAPHKHDYSAIGFAATFLAQ